MTVQNLWDAAKAVLKGKNIAIQAYLKKQEKSQIHNLTLHLKKLRKEHQTKPKASRRREITKIRAEINNIETNKKKWWNRSTKLKSWFLERIDEIDKPLARLINKKRERTQINRWNWLPAPCRTLVHDTFNPQECVLTESSSPPSPLGHYSEFLHMINVRLLSPW